MFHKQLIYRSIKLTPKFIAFQLLPIFCLGPLYIYVLTFILLKTENNLELRAEPVDELINKWSANVNMKCGTNDGLTNEKAFILFPLMLPQWTSHLRRYKSFTGNIRFKGSSLLIKKISITILICILIMRVAKVPQQLATLICDLITFYYIFFYMSS